MTAPTVKAIVLRTAGTNCDHETAAALARAGANPERVHVGRLRQRPALLDGVAILALPGGFSYGDDLGAGRILGNEVRFHLSEAIARFVDRGGLVIGICNGFQVLVQAGLLPGGDAEGAAPDACVRPVTLAGNESDRFESRWIHLEVTTDRSPWLEPGDRLEMPVAHGEGRLVARDAATLERLERRGQVALRYACPRGGPARGYPDNPSGSARGAAALCDPTGRILGLMPHPERNVIPEHHPGWTRRGPAGHRAGAPAGGRGAASGLRVFERAVRHARSLG